MEMKGVFTGLAHGGEWIGFLCISLFFSPMLRL